MLDNERGYIFQVDLEYPKEIHDIHNQYPLCPERKKVCTIHRRTHLKLIHHAV